MTVHDLERIAESDLVRDGVTIRPITFRYDDIGAEATIRKGTNIRDLIEKLRSFEG